MANNEISDEMLVKRPELRKIDGYTCVAVVVNMHWGFGTGRGAVRFSEEAQKYERGVFLGKDGEIYNLKSVLETMMASSEQGKELEILVEGTDESAERIALRIYSGMISENSVMPYFDTFVGRA